MPKHALLTEGVAGSGKTTALVKTVQNRVQLHDCKALLLTHSATGLQVMRQYIKQYVPTDQQNAIYTQTLDGMALQLLQNYFLDEAYILSEDYVVEHVLPQVYANMLARWQEVADLSDIDIPMVSPSNMRALLDDMLFFRASCAFEYEDDPDHQRFLLSGRLSFDWRVVSRMLMAYDALRMAWLPPENWPVSPDPVYPILHRGTLGFRIARDAVYDLLQTVDDPSSISEKVKGYAFLGIDEFHDTSVLQWRFVRALAEPMYEVMAVGDRHQNIFVWDGSDPDTVFHAFLKELPSMGASVVQRQLTHSYRFNAPIAKLASAFVSTKVHTHGTVHSQVRRLQKLPTTPPDAVIARDEVAMVQAAFYLRTHSNWVLSYSFGQHLAIGLMNVLFVLSFGQQLRAGHPLLTRDALAQSLTHLWRLPHSNVTHLDHKALLDELLGFGVSELGYTQLVNYMQLQLDASLGRPHFKLHFQQTISQFWYSDWRYGTVFDLMQWLERALSLWSSQALSVFDLREKAAWDGLKAHAAETQCLLKDWDQQLTRYWLRRPRRGQTPVALFSVKEAKGREFNHTLLFQANRQGFVGCAPLTLEKRFFYVATTRAREQLDLLQVPSLGSYGVDIPSFAPSQAPSSPPATPASVALAKAELARIKQQLRDSLAADHEQG